MGALIEKPGLKGKTSVFQDRHEAGAVLASHVADVIDPEGILLAIPAGGVPVGCPVAAENRIPMEVVIVRKIQIPGNPEAGFGAIGPDGEVLLNERIVEDLRLTGREIKAQVAKTRSVLKERERIFRRGRPRPELKGRQVILVDDGLASGYTMMAAVEFARQREAKQVIVAVPTGSQRTVNHLRSKTDILICLNVRGGPVFAVADAYRHWYDLDDEEVIRLLGEGAAGGDP
jgi:predicted phosphoribosyltransferase